MSSHSATAVALVDAIDLSHPSVGVELNILQATCRRPSPHSDEPVAARNLRVGQVEFRETFQETDGARLRQWEVLDLTADPVYLGTFSDQEVLESCETLQDVKSAMNPDVFERALTQSGAVISRKDSSECYRYLAVQPENSPIGVIVEIDAGRKAARYCLCATEGLDHLAHAFDPAHNSQEETTEYLPMTSKLRKAITTDFETLQAIHLDVDI